MDFGAQPSSYWCRYVGWSHSENCKFWFSYSWISGMSVLSTVPVMKTYRKYFHYSWTLYAVMEQNFIKKSETFPRIPLPHPYIMLIYFECKNFDPLSMSCFVAAVVFVTFVPKSFEFQLCIFKAFINAGTSQFCCILQAWQQKKKKNPTKQLNLLFSGAQISSLSLQHPLKSSKSGVVVFAKVQYSFNHCELGKCSLLSFPKHEKVAVALGYDVGHRRIAHSPAPSHTITTVLGNEVFVISKWIML